MRALLDNAEVKLSSKASLAPLEIMKIHRDLFNSLQDAPEGVSQKRAGKNLSKGTSQGKKVVGPSYKKPKPNDAEPCTYQANVPVSQEGDTNEP